MRQSSLAGQEFFSTFMPISLLETGIKDLLDFLWQHNIGGNTRNHKKKYLWSALGATRCRKHVELVIYILINTLTNTPNICTALSQNFRRGKRTLCLPEAVSKSFLWQLVISREGFLLISSRLHTVWYFPDKTLACMLGAYWISRSIHSDQWQVKSKFQT